MFCPVKLSWKDRFRPLGLSEQREAFGRARSGLCRRDLARRAAEAALGKSPRPVWARNSAAPYRRELNATDRLRAQIQAIDKRGYQV